MTRAQGCLVLLSIFLAVIIPESRAQDCIDFALLPEEIHSLNDGQEILAVAADGDHFCYATTDAGGSGLRVVWGSAAEGSAPEILGEYLSTDGKPEALTCQGSLACVVYRVSGTVNGGWLLIDFTDADSPVLRSQSFTSIRGNDLDMSGDLICLAASGDGFLIIDISDPDAPVQISTLPEVNWAVTVAEDAGVWYVAGHFEQDAFVRAYDLSLPENPALIGEHTDIYSMDYGSMPLGLDADGSDVGVFRNNYYRDYLGPLVSNLNIQVLDFSDSENIVETERIYYGYTFAGTPAMGNGMVYFPVLNTLDFIEKTGASWSEKYGQSTNSIAIPVCVSGSRVFGGDGTRFVEYSPGVDSPAPVAGSVSSYYSAGIDLEVTDTHAFVSWFTPNDGSIGSYDTGFVAVYDLSVPATPVSSHTFYAYMGAPIGYFVIHGEYAHTDLGSFHWPTGDLPAAHVNMYRDGVVRGDVLYAIEYDGFRVYDLTIPDTPTAVGNDYLESVHLTTLVQGEGHLYAFGADLSIFDLADPLVPDQVSTESFSDSVLGGEVTDGKLFLAGDAGLLIYDLTTPADPVFLGQLSLESCRDVSVSGNTAYVTAGNAGLVAVDVTDATAPVLLGDFHAGSQAKVVQVRNGYVYVLSEHELTVLEAQCLSPSGVDDGGLPGNASPAMRFAPPYPNPFNPITCLRFDLDRSGPVELTIYDAAGRRLRTLVKEHRESGSHLVQWDGRDDTGAMVPAGIYFARAKSLDGMTTHKMALIK